MTTITDITARTDEAAVSLLCTFGEVIKTAAGSVELHDGDHFVLTQTDGRVRNFSTASGAVEVLRRISK